ncbi:MAG: PQQ-binding-like beta-propeller repeat protein, partial [Syntrophomonas sp.]
MRSKYPLIKLCSLTLLTLLLLSGLILNAMAVQAPTPPTNPVVNDNTNEFGWTYVSGFTDCSQYEYSTNAGVSWNDCTANPQPVGDYDFAAGSVQVRIKANSGEEIPAGSALLSDQAFTAIPAAPTNPLVDDLANTFGWTNVVEYSNVSEYEYSVDGGTNWNICTANPQYVGDYAFAIGAVQVRIKSDITQGKPAGLTMQSNIPFTKASSPIDIITFYQGSGYQRGAYDLNAVQPAGDNWTRQFNHRALQTPKVSWTGKYLRSYYSGAGLIAIGSNQTAYVVGSGYRPLNGKYYFTGDLYAVDLADGRNKWTFDLGSWTFSSPVIGADGTVYVGTLTGKLFAVNPDGTQKWQYQLPASGDNVNEILGDPSISVDGVIYVGGCAGDSEGALYAFNPDGTLKWTFAEGGGSTECSPSIGSDGTIYFGANDNAMYAVKPDGTKKWKYSTIGRIADSIIGNDGTIIFCSINESTEAKKLCALNPDGTIKWTYTPNSEFQNDRPLAVGNNAVYFGTTDGKLCAVNISDGQLIWTATIGASDTTSPVVDSDGIIYIGCNKLYAIESDGSQKWIFNNPSGNTTDDFRHMPVIDRNGDIYIASGSDGTVYRIVNDNGSSSPDTVMLNQHTVLGQNGNYDFAGIYEYDNLIIGDNVEIASKGISQLVLKVNGTLTLGKNDVIRVRNGFSSYSGAPTEVISSLNASNLNTKGIDGGGFRLYPNMYGKGGNGGNGGTGQYAAGWNRFLGFGQYDYVPGDGGSGGGGGGGGFGGGYGGSGGSGGSGSGINGLRGSNGNDNGGSGGYGGAAGANSSGAGGEDLDIGGRGSNGGWQNFGAGGGGGGGNGGPGYSGDGKQIWGGYGGGGGGGGGYGGGVLTIIANKIEYDPQNPPFFVVSGQEGGYGGSGYVNGGSGQNGQGGLLVIQCANYQSSPDHWNLGKNTLHGTYDDLVSIPGRTITSINGGHGIVTGNPQKVFLNGVDVTSNSDIPPIDTNPDVISINATPSEVAMNVGDTKQITVTAEPADAQITYTPSDTSVI